MTAEIFPDVLRHADAAEDSVKIMIRVAPEAMTAPIAYDVIGKLEAMSYLLPHVFDQISAGLTRALIDFETYEHDGGDPEISTATARVFLARAGELAVLLGDALDEAQTAISEQGHRIA